jgi:hypothetical protein
MMNVSKMIETHPAAIPIDAGILSRCIEDCVSCAQTCAACADACLAEDSVAELVRCIGLGLVCADVCATTAATLTRPTAFEPQLGRRVVEACLDACRRCGDECEKHADHHEHCRICAEDCRRCAQTCEELLGALPS